MSNEERWLEVTTIGSPYEEQLLEGSSPPRFRHRIRNNADSTWLEGPAPRK